jgi:parallel beta-helix repeat protein
MHTMKRCALTLSIAFAAACDPGPTHITQPSHDLEASQAASTAVLHVPRDFPTIQAAVTAAQSGDIIQVQSGTYNEQVVVTTSGLRLHAVSGVVLDGTGLTGTGILVLGASAAAPITGVEVSGFEVRHFERGIIVGFGAEVRIHRNSVHHNVDKVPPVVLGDAAGIELNATRGSTVSDNLVFENGVGGIQLRVGSADNMIRGNSISRNGTQVTGNLNGRGILLTGAGTNDNQILSNEVLNNNGYGIIITRPLNPTVAPISGNRVAENRLHGNQRSGIAIMGAAAGNSVQQNDARGNALSGLPPCFRCDLVDLSIGGNVWERNLGAFNLTDDCDLQSE